MAEEKLPIEQIDIKISADTTEAINGITKLVAALGKIQNSVSAPNKGLQTVASTIEALGKAADTISRESVENLENLAGALHGLASVPDLTSGKMTKSLAKLGEVLNDIGGDTIDTIEGISAQIDSLNGDVELVSQTIESKSNSAAKAAANAGNKIKDATDKVGKGAKNAKKDTESAFDKIGKSFKNLTTMFSRRILYRAFNKIISTITSSFKTGIDAVYQYSKSFAGSFSEAMDTIATSTHYITASLGAMASPLIEAVAPAVDWLADKFVGLLNIVNQIFARLAGKDTWTRAIKKQVEYADATDDATKANKRFKASILGIDEINPLQDNTPAASGSGNSKNDLGSYEFVEETLNKSKVDDIIDKLKDILWYVGAIKLGMSAWDWGKALSNLKAVKSPIALKAGLALSVAGLTIEVSGLVDIISKGINWKNLLTTLGGAGGVVGGGALIGKAFGSSALGAAIGAIVGGVPMYIGGIWDAIKEGLNWLNGLLIDAGATLAGAGIGAIIGMCGGPIGAGIGALIGLAVGALTDLTILIVQNWDTVVDWCKRALSNIGQFFVNLWNNICDAWSVVADWFNTYVIQPVANFFSGLWSDISSTASKCWDKIVEIFSPIAQWFSDLFSSVWQTISDVFYDIGVMASGCWEVIKQAWSVVAAWFNENVIQPVANFFSGLWNSIKNWAINAWGSIKSVFSTIGNWMNTYVVQPVSKFFTNMWDGFLNKAKAAWEGVKSVFSTVATFFKNTFEKAWQGVIKVFSVAGDIFVDIKDGIVNAFKKVVNGLITGLNKVVSLPFKGINSALEWVKKINIMGLKPFEKLKTISVPQIPLLAEGGTVSSGQMFIAREAGPELVGQIGNRNAVVNNDQIIAGISEGVADANAEQNALLREEISILRKILDKNVSYSNYNGARSIINDMERKNRRDGKTIIPVGV